MSSTWKGEYDVVPSSENESSERTISDVDARETENLFSRDQNVSGHRSGLWVLTIGTALNLLLFVVSVGILIWVKTSSPDSQLNASLRQSSSYSPIFDMIDLDLHTVQVNGTFFPDENPSVGRQWPNPEADAVWDEWELIRVMPITAEQVRALGKDPSTVAKFEDEYWHFGDDAYMASLDVFHQLHCLNTLRKTAYDDYYSYGLASSKRPKLWHVHINHCIDILMQSLQCNNVNLVTLQWMETQTFPFPDFSINRQCIDFEKLVDFRKETTVDLEKLKNITKPVGVKEVPISDMYYDVYDLKNPGSILDLGDR